MYYFFRGLFIYEQQMGTLHYTVQEKVKTVLGLLYTVCMQSISKYKSIATQCLSTSLLYSDIQDNCLTIFPEMYKHKGYFVGKWLKTPYQQQSDDGHLFKRQYYYRTVIWLQESTPSSISFWVLLRAKYIKPKRIDIQRKPSQNSTRKQAEWLNMWWVELGHICGNLYWRH